MVDLTLASNEATLWRAVANDFKMRILGRTFEKKGKGAIMQYYMVCEKVGAGFIVFSYHDDYFPTSVMQPWSKARSINDPVTFHLEFNCLPKRKELAGKNIFFPNPRK